MSSATAMTECGSAVNPGETIVRMQCGPFDDAMRQFVLNVLTATPDGNKATPPTGGGGWLIAPIAQIVISYLPIWIRFVLPQPYEAVFGSHQQPHVRFMSRDGCELFARSYQFEMPRTDFRIRFDSPHELYGRAPAGFGVPQIAPESESDSNSDAESGADSESGESERESANESGDDRMIDTELTAVTVLATAAAVPTGSFTHTFECTDAGTGRSGSDGGSGSGGMPVGWVGLSFDVLEQPRNAHVSESLYYLHSHANAIIGFIPSKYARRYSGSVGVAFASLPPEHTSGGGVLILANGHIACFGAFRQLDSMHAERPFSMNSGARRHPPPHAGFRAGDRISLRLNTRTRDLHFTVRRPNGMHATTTSTDAVHGMSDAREWLIDTSVVRTLQSNEIGFGRPTPPPDRTLPKPHPARPSDDGTNFHTVTDLIIPRAKWYRPANWPPLRSRHSLPIIDDTVAQYSQTDDSTYSFVVGTTKEARIRILD